MLRKNRKLPIIVGSLAAIALFSVGFSAWIVSGQVTNEEVGDITVNVGDVKNNALALVPSVTDNKYKFDANGTTIEGGKISAATGSEEDTSFAFSIEIGLKSRLSGSTFGPYAEGDSDVSTLFNKVKLNIAPSESATTDQVTAFNAAFAASSNTDLSSVVSPIDITNGTEYTLTSLSDGAGTAVNWNDGASPYLKENIYRTAYAPTSRNTVQIYFTLGFCYNAFFGYKNPTQFVESGSNYLDSEGKGAIQKLQNLHLMDGTPLTITVSTL